MTQEQLHKEFKAMKKDLRLTNRDIAEITGLNYDSVKTLLQPNKDLPRWARLTLHVYKKVSMYTKG